MEASLSISLIVFSFLILLSCVVRAAYSILWKPKKLEKQLRQQGINGTSYKILHGDWKEYVRSMEEAWSKPMSLTHQIVPRVIPFVHEIVQNYGKLSLHWNGTTPRVTVNDPEQMKEVLLNKSGHFQQPPVNPIIKQIAMGVSSMEGEKWAKHRRIITPAFYPDKLKGMAPAFSTRDIISRTAFGSNYVEGKRIFQLQKEQVVLVLEAAFSVYVPGLRFVPTKKNKRRLYLDNEIKSTLRDLIHRKEEAMKMGESSNDDLLGLLLQSTDCNEGGTNSKNIRLTIDEVIEECKLFYFAGHETTSVWLTWTMVVLAMHPNWQERAREEVLQICGKNTPKFESTNQLKIVTMILNEVQRLYPPVTGLFRDTTEKTRLGEISLPANVDLYLPTLLIHHDPEIWGEDSQEFKPERFSAGISAASKENFAFFPFGWGPRICIGQSFAMIEAKIALATILQHFSFELSPSYTHAPYTVITLQPQFGAPIILHQL
ncbi:hypothetical protein MRB53_015672 [Persea americana]|uniref:Uncharacterized protein n=1 Tax=Persea americana TaxID=3435 RepID=A0ACC2M014_PERAE|nr:hypothetical protein MRB53_015672 [Persea americana]